MILDLLNKASKLNWVSQGLSLITRVEVVVVEVNCSDAALSLLDYLLRAETVCWACRISYILVSVQPSLSQDHLLTWLSSVRVLWNSMSLVLKSLDTARDLCVGCGFHQSIEILVALASKAGVSTLNELCLTVRLFRLLVIETCIVCWRCQILKSLISLNNRVILISSFRKVLGWL